MGGRYFRITRNEMNWQPGNRMKGEIKCMAAGKTPKDGLYASVVHADEHGQAGYVNNRSDMQAAVDTCFGSTGPRREKLLLHTTTAGRIQNGPYKQKLEQVEASLEKEMNYPLGESHRTEEDVWTAFLLQLDKPEITDDLTKLDDPELFKKCNRSIGTTVQPTYYRERLHEAATGPQDTKQEVLTKDMNIWQTGSVQEWIKPDEVRPLQTSLRVDDCTMADGWVTFGGMDFSQGDDLHTVAWLSARRHPSGRGTQFHADCDCWIKQDTLERSAIRALYEEWIERGWLHVSPGKVFQPSLFIGRLDELIKKGVQFMYFGYDKYQSKDPVNSLKAYFQSVLNVTNPEPYVQVVSQLNSEFNAPTDKLYAAMFAPEPFITFSANPLWPWCFGNAVLEIDGRENKRPVKRQPGVDSCKVDPVQAIIMALDLYERYEGAMH
jgi:phage terminase large subunit-like protein